MSVASEITRLTNAKAAIKASIEAKGVTVPSSALLNAYSDYVDLIPQGSINLQSKSVSPTTSEQTVTPDSGYNGLSSVTVGAIQTETKSITPSTSQQTINPTSGKYISQVTVSAIQTETKSATPSTSQQTITPSNGKFLTQVTVGAVTSSIDNNITAGNIKSGVTILGVTGTYGGGGGSTLVPTAGDYPVVENANMAVIRETALTDTGISITIPVTGTYRLKWSAARNGTSGTNSTQLYRTRNGSTSAIGTEITNWTSYYIQNNSLDIACNEGDVITVYARSRSTGNFVAAGNLSACVAQKLWTN